MGEQVQPDRRNEDDGPGQVVLVGAGDYTPHAPLGKAPRDQRARPFGGIALPPEFLSDPPSDIGGRGMGGFEFLILQADKTDKFPGGQEICGIVGVAPYPEMILQLPQQGPGFLRGKGGWKITHRLRIRV